MAENEGLLRQEHAASEDIGSGETALSASELAGRKTLTQIFLASLVPFETATRMRKNFRIGPRSWTLIPPR